MELETKLKEKKYLRIKRQNDITNPQSSSSGVSKGNGKSGEINNATLTYNESAESLGRAEGQRPPARLPSESDAALKGKLNESVHSNRVGGKPNVFELDEHQAPGNINRLPSDLPSSGDEPMATGAIMDEQLSQPQNAVGSETKSRKEISATNRSSSATSSSISEALPSGKVETVKKLVPRIMSEQHSHSKLNLPNASSCEDTSSSTSLKSYSDSKKSKSLDKPVPATLISALPSTNVEDTVHLYEQETQGTQKKPVKSSRSWITAGEAHLGAERHVDWENVQPPDTHSHRDFHEEQAVGDDIENAMDTQSNWLERLGTKIKKMPSLPRALFSKKGHFDHAGLANEAKNVVSDTGTALPIRIADGTVPTPSQERDGFEQGPTASPIVPVQQKVPKHHFPPPGGLNQTRNARNLVGSTTRTIYSDYGSTPTFLEAWILYISPDTGRVTTNPLPINNSELQEILRKFNKKGRLVWQSLALLSSLQQQAINLLLLDKYKYDNSREPLAWTLQALEIFPKRSKAAKIRSIKILIEARSCPRSYAIRQLRLYQQIEQERRKQMDQSAFPSVVSELTPVEEMEQERSWQIPHPPRQGHLAPRMLQMPAAPPQLHHIQPGHHARSPGFERHGHHGYQPQLDRDHHHSDEDSIRIEVLGHDDRYDRDFMAPRIVPLQPRSFDDSEMLAYASTPSKSSGTGRRSPSEVAMRRGEKSIVPGQKADRLDERLRRRRTEERKRRRVPMESIESQEPNKSQSGFRHRFGSNLSRFSSGPAVRGHVVGMGIEPEVTRHSSSDLSRSSSRPAVRERVVGTDIEPEVTIDNLLSKWTIFGTQK